MNNRLRQKWHETSNLISSFIVAMLILVAPDHASTAASKPPLPTPAIDSRGPRPILRHSNNLHHGSFMVFEPPEDDEDSHDHHSSRSQRDKEPGDGRPCSSRPPLPRRTNNQYRRQNNMGYRLDESEVLNGIVSDHDHHRHSSREWSKFHDALRRERKRSGTHSSLQESVGQLLLEEEDQEPVKQGCN